MSSLLHLVVPWALLAGFLLGAFRWRIFLLGIPFLMLMDASVFFDTMKLFHIPGRLGANERLLLWLCLVWVFATGKLLARQSSEDLEPAGRRASPLLPEELVVVALGALVLGHTVADALRGGDFGGSTGRSLGMLSMVVGYFLIRDIVAHASRREVILFLTALVVVNLVATLMFILHQGLHMHVYSVAEKATFLFGGRVLTRSHTFAPPFVVLTISFVLARRRWTPLWALVLVTTLVGIWVSYTRIWLVVFVAELMLALLLRQLKQPAASRLLKRVLALVVLGLTLFWASMVFIPTETRYFEQRLGGLRSNPTGAGDTSFLYRSQFLSSTIDVVRAKDLVFGLGYPPESATPEAEQVRLWGSDMAWITVVYRLGVAGVLVFVILFVSYGARAFMLFMRGSDDGEYLGLVFALAIAGIALSTAGTWAFMKQGGLPLGLWIFAFLAAEARRGKRIEPASSPPAPAGAS
jgi:hypothetical protein